MTRRYKITLAYDGTNFAGFQVQPNQRTVQSVLEAAVNKMSKNSDYITIYGSGRTDAGVHALGQVVHFDYMYRVSRGRFTNPFKRFYTGHYKYPLDIEKIKEAMPDLVGTHDFSSFVASGSQTKNHVRTIYEATVREDKENDEIIFEFCGNGFLYNQVRIMVATLLEIGNGKRPVHDFLRLYEVKDRNECRETAPASGLYLKEVYYD